MVPLKKAEKPAAPSSDRIKQANGEMHAPHFHPNMKLDHSKASKDQPIVKCVFGKMVCVKNRELAAGVEHELPLDLAHSLAKHMVLKK